MNSMPSDPPGFSIRPAEPSDAPLVLEFIQKLAAYEKLSHEMKVTEEDIRKRLFGDRPYAEVIIGENNGRPVGFALFFHNFSTFEGRPGLYLEDLFVNPEDRGQSYGKGMMLYLARLARERECGRFEWSVLDWNEPSIAFYRSLGAKPMEDWTIYRMAGDALEKLGG